MNTEGLVWFENLNMNPEGDYRYYAYRNPKIKEGYLHETYNGYTVIDATFPAWELHEGILRCETASGTRWIDIASIHCIGI